MLTESALGLVLGGLIAVTGEPAARLPSPAGSGRSGSHPPFSVVRAWSPFSDQPGWVVLFLPRLGECGATLGGRVGLAWEVVVAGGTGIRRRFLVKAINLLAKINQFGYI